MDTVKVLNDEICKECSNGIGRVAGSESSSNALLCADTSAGTPERFEAELFELINKHVAAGLRKPDLVKKMRRATGNCEFS